MKGTMSIGEFAKRLGVSPITVRRYIKKGLITPLKTPAGRYRFTEEHIRQFFSLKEKETPKKVVIYARVSTQKQKAYLENQIELCKQYCASKGLQIDEIITDIASSFNFKRKGLKKLLDMVVDSQVDTVVIYSKDRLSRIAFELIEEIFSRLNVKIEVVDKSEKLASREQRKDAVGELISFIHYITSEIYGSRSYKAKKIGKCIKDVLEDKNSNT
ncbi:MAG TPA: IS607 family transposase [Aquificaceae bacterium]|nr:IS607 family transposase [Aquificaceae bacterium]